jgi:hypothetical protein
MPFLNRYNLFIKDTKAAISIEIAAFCLVFSDPFEFNDSLTASMVLFVTFDTLRI